MALNQLNCQARLSDATTTNNDELIFSQELSAKRWISQLSFGAVPWNLAYLGGHLDFYV
jgi:hypothetical protein